MTIYDGSVRVPAFVEHRVRLADNRRVMVAEYGERSAVPIVYLHGFLGSRFEPLIAGPLGINILALDRPGYGGSMPRPDYSLRGFGEDVRSVLDRLGIERCALVGVSAGAPYAVAAGAVLGRRVTRCLLGAGVADKRTILDAGGAVLTFRRLRRRLGLLRKLMPGVLRNVRRHALDARILELSLGAELPLLAPHVDRAQVIRAMVGAFREGTRPGLGGGFTDIRVLTRRWDVDPAELRVPVHVLHGDADRVVPVAHSLWYARVLPAAELEIVPGLGHVSLLVNEAPRLAAILQDRG